ncbi:electron transfer flavoprotein subunit beta [Hypericibacter terrae]|uniref:Electron transfer flavoprotein subunit beta n=1 Tax=Hypericibacter terrae TaxID=2602015 RepID=A0A5J6MK42_9PROT|nr:electron transfer flavoprotein subunit beta/FixA family protein [Hypericibacter terrae]QEX17743.1 electron transfer flavoprotein subunit beta [Hypericibacter terrae]
MHIVTVVRLVPDLLEEIQVNEQGTDIDREWIGVKLCEFDDHALEESVLIKEATGATVTAVGIAVEGMDRVLQSAVARGADRAVKIDCGEANPDSRALAKLLCEALAQLKPDLILAGVQTPEDLFGQLVPFLGALMGRPHASGVTGAQVEGNAVVIQQEYGAGRAARLKLALPAVLGVQSASQPPRYVSGTKLRQAIQGTKIETLSAAASAGNNGAVKEMRRPSRGQGAEMIDGEAEAVAGKIFDALVARGLVGGK